MAFKRGDSFDLYSGITTGGFPLSTVYDFGRTGFTTGGGPIYQLIAGRFGGQALRVSDSGGFGAGGSTWVNRALTGSRTALTLSFALRRMQRDMSNTGDGVPVTRLRTGTGAQISFGVDFLGRVLAWNDAAGSASLGRSSEPDQVLAGNWHSWDIELENIHSATIGRIGLWIDGGREALGLTGLDLSAMNASGVDNYDLIMQTLNGSNIICDFDDSYELDVATRLTQPIKAEVLRPSSDVGPNQWTPSSGTDHYAMVDDVTGDGDATTLSSSTVGNKDRWGLTDLSTTPAAIYALQAVTVGRKTDAGLRQIRTNFISGTTTGDGHTQTQGINYAPEYDVAETDPDTSAAWNASGVNNLDVEVEHLA